MPIARMRYLYTDSPVLTVADVAAHLHICLSKAYDLVRTPGFPVLRTGKTIRIDRAQFLAWVAQRAAE